MFFIKNKVNIIYILVIFAIFFFSWQTADDIITCLGVCLFAISLKNHKKFIDTIQNVILILCAYLFFISSHFALSINNYLNIILILPYIIEFTKKSNKETLLSPIKLISIALATIGVYLAPSYLFIIIYIQLITSDIHHRLTQLIFALFLGIGLLLHLTTYMWVDMAWILDSTQQLINGGVFGKDIVDSNPPFIWYLSVPLVWLSKLTNWHIEHIFWVTICFLTSLILLWVTSLIKREPKKEIINPNTLLLASGYVFFIGSGETMGQREYLTLLFTLPYMAMTILRLNGSKPSFQESALAGIIAGIGVAFKPYFLVIPFFVELVAYIKKKQISFIYRSEVIFGFITVSIFYIILFTFASQYIFDIVPLLRKSFWAWNVSYSFLIVSGGAVVAALLIPSILSQRVKFPSLLYLFLASGFGFTISYIIQRKDFYYHKFPIFALAIIILSILISETIQRRNYFLGKFKKNIIILVILLTISLAIRTEDAKKWYDLQKKFTKNFDIHYSNQKKIIDLLNQYDSKEKFLGVSIDLYPGFPTAIYVKPQWAGIDVCRRYISAIQKIRYMKPTNKLNKIRLELEAKERQQIADEMRLNPIIILVKSSTSRIQGPFNILDFYMEDPNFRKAFSKYQELEPVGDVRVFKRMDT